MVLRALCMVTAGAVGAEAEPGPGAEAARFLVSAAPCPDAALALGPVLSEPEGKQLVLCGEAGFTMELFVPGCCCCCCGLARIIPLLPTTEPCGGSESDTPFSFAHSSSSSPRVSEVPLGPRCLESHSTPLGTTSGDAHSLVDASRSVTEARQQKNPNTGEMLEWEAISQLLRRSLARTSFLLFFVDVVLARRGTAVHDALGWTGRLFWGRKMKRFRQTLNPNLCR